MVANEWRHGAAVLHLREALKDGAQDCGRAGDLHLIFNALRARYGLSSREARARLSNLKKDSRTSLQEHAVEVERLVSVAYEDLPAVHRAGMVLETFSNTLGNAYLQRHLLAVDPVNVEAAVRAGNDFLQIRSAPERGRGLPTVRGIDEEEEPKAEVTTPKTAELLATLMKAMQEMAEQMRRLQLGKPSPAALRKSEDSPRTLSCWGCGKSGHLRRDCRTRSWPGPQAAPRAAQAGNEPGPQQ
jgi:hypothetical protein